MSLQSGQFRRRASQGEISLQAPPVKREKDGPMTVRYRCPTAYPHPVHNDECGKQ